MYRPALIGVAITMMCACARHAVPPATVTSDELVATVNASRTRWNTAIVARDTATLRQLASDSIIETSPFLTRVGRDRYVGTLAALMGRRPSFGLNYAPEHIEARAVFGNVIATEAGIWRESWLESGEATEI